MSRYFPNWTEALNEIPRDLKELGTRRVNKSVQDRQFEVITRELANYEYTVVAATDTSGIPLSDNYAAKELAERLAGDPVNPGTAWRERPETWEQYIHGGGFSYTYPQRLHMDMVRQSKGSVVVENITPWAMVQLALMEDLNTRQAFLPIFDRTDLLNVGGKARIPCSLGYWFHYDDTEHVLDVTYLQRSCDFGKHYMDDVWLACRMLFAMSKSVGVQPGSFSHWIGSLHVFEDEVADVF